MVVTVEHKIEGTKKTYYDADVLEMNDSTIRIKRGDMMFHSATHKKNVYDVTYSRRFWQIADGEGRV